MPELVFDRFLLDTDRRILLREGQMVDLQPLVFDLLALLARRPRKVVTRAELLPAVWRSTSVTETVVARAVMKARRALLDDAQAPKLLRTVPRVGYSLEADVVETAASAPQPLQAWPSSGKNTRLALLPVENATGLTALGWIDHGLMRLLHQWLEATGTVSLVSSQEILDVCAGITAPQDTMNAVCRTTGVADAVRTQVTWHDDTFSLRSWRGDQFPGRLVFEQSGADLLDLARRLADALTGQNLLEATSEADSFWQQQISSVVRLQQNGLPAQALALLESSLPHTQTSLALSLLQVRLLYQCNRLPDALRHIDVLLNQTEPVLSEVVQVELLDLRGDCLHQCDRLHEAMDSFRQALQKSALQPLAHPLRPDILGRAARVALRLLNPREALSLAEAAVEEADRVGGLCLQARASLSLCTVLLSLDQLIRARGVLDKTLDLAQRSGVLDYEARAVRYLSTMQNHLRQNRAAYESSKRAVVLSLRAGNESNLVWARLHELASCIWSGRLEEADKAAASFSDRTALPATQRDYLELLQGVLDWRAGRDQMALDRLRALTRAQPTMNDCRTVAHGEMVFMCIHLGHLSDAHASMAASAMAPMSGFVERRQAALALAGGDRTRAIQWLRDYWREGYNLSNDGICIMTDLTWMLLENAPARFDDPELESLFAHILDLSDEMTDIQILKAAYILRQQPNDHTRAAWDEAIAQAPVLNLRCPVMTTPSYREAMAARTPPRLTELLSWVCF